MKEHSEYIEKCLLLAEKALTSGNPPVGTIIVENQEVIGEGIESARSTGHVTDHAEILAMRNAVDRGHSARLKNATLYSTHEPCLMCSYAIRHYKIPLIICGSSVEHIGGYSSKFNVLSTDQVPSWKSIPQVIIGASQEESEELNERFRNSLK